MQFISDREEIIYRSPWPQDLYCYTPSLANGFNGRLLLSFDIAGPGLKKFPGPKTDIGDFGSNQLHIYFSDDRGRNWQPSATLAMLHARIFKAGKALYVIGHSGRLIISRSDDNGETWSRPTVLNEGPLNWHQSACSMDYRHGKVYLSMEHMPFKDRWGSAGDPILMAAREEDDLCRPASWTFSNKAEFLALTPRSTDICGANPSCWLESNVVRIYDPNHRLYDPEDRSVLLFLRLRSMLDNYAAVLKGYEAPDGSLSLDTVKQPDGTPLLYVPFPGGGMKFQIAYDEQDKLYWLIATQTAWHGMNKHATFSRERRRLELYYSQNLFDWGSAGMVAIGPAEHASRHYASLLIVDEDMLVLSRSGDLDAKSRHDTNLITLHRIPNFRRLAPPPCNPTDKR
ncbi:MAG: sialidase family protein [Lentisphaeria bacterium]|jgi:hypothetical protein